MVRYVQCDIGGHQRVKYGGMVQFVHGQLKSVVHCSLASVQWLNSVFWFLIGFRLVQEPPAGLQYVAFVLTNVRLRDPQSYKL